MKKYWILCLSIILLMSFTACNKSENDHSNEKADITNTLDIPNTPIVTQSVKPRYYPEKDISARPYGYSSGSYEEYPVATPIPEEDIIYLNLTEDEILNMSDEDLCYYADLEAKRLLGNSLSYQDNPKKKVYEDIKNVIGSKYDSYLFPAASSAEDYDDALRIAESEFPAKGNMGFFKNIRYIGEYDGFYVFTADYYHENKFSHITGKIIYKKEYYDAETKTLKCELNYDNILNFLMTYQYLNLYGIGGFFSETEEEYAYRIYTIGCVQGDWGLYDRAYLELTECTVSKAGVLSITKNGHIIKEADITYRYNPDPPYDL